MTDAARRTEHELSPDERAQLEAALRELHEAVVNYEQFLGGAPERGKPVPVHDASDMAAAQDRVSAAEDHLWELRERHLGWRRPGWAPSAIAVSDWFSPEDEIYDDLPDATAS